MPSECWVFVMIWFAGACAAQNFTAQESDFKTDENINVYIFNRRHQLNTTGKVGYTIIYLFLNCSFPSFLPFPFLACCAILSSLFGDKGSHLRRLMAAQPSSTVFQLRFSRVFLSCKVNAKRSVHSLRYHLIITRIIS